MMKWKILIPDFSLIHVIRVSNSRYHFSNSCIKFVLSLFSNSCTKIRVVTFLRIRVIRVPNSCYHFESLQP